MNYPKYLSNHFGLVIAVLILWAFAAFSWYEGFRTLSVATACTGLAILIIAGIDWWFKKRGL